MPGSRESEVRGVAASDATKSDKIRRLNRMGLSRAHIARALDVRYQFVRNVLEHDSRRDARPTRLSPAERRRIDELTANLATKAARIRALHAEGFDRSRIAEALGLRYQHVYNVLTQSGRKTDRVAERPSASAAWLEQPVAAAPAGLPVRVVMDAARRVTIPDTLAAAVGISAGDDVLLCQEGDELRLYGQEAAIRRVQRLVAQHVPADVSLVDELLAERRREAEREAGDG